MADTFTATITSNSNYERESSQEQAIICGVMGKEMSVNVDVKQCISFLQGEGWREGIQAHQE